MHLWIFLIGMIPSVLCAMKVEYENPFHQAFKRQCVVERAREKEMHPLGDKKKWYKQSYVSDRLRLQALLEAPDEYLDSELRNIAIKKRSDDFFKKGYDTSWDSYKCLTLDIPHTDPITVTITKFDTIVQVKACYCDEKDTVAFVYAGSQRVVDKMYTHVEGSGLFILSFTDNRRVHVAQVDWNECFEQRSFYVLLFPLKLKAGLRGSFPLERVGAYRLSSCGKFLIVSSALKVSLESPVKNEVVSYAWPLCVLLPKLTKLQKAYVLTCMNARDDMHSIERSILKIQEAKEIEALPKFFKDLFKIEYGLSL